MSERTNNSAAKAKKGKAGNSNAANSTKASMRAPQRITTVQKLHLRLLEVGAGGGDRRAPADTAAGAGTGSGARPAATLQPPEGSSVSRDSSPGIDLVPPPREPPAEPPPPPPPPKRPAKRTAAQIFRELARCRAEQEEEMKR